MELSSLDHTVNAIDPKSLRSILVAPFVFFNTRILNYIHDSGWSVSSPM